MSSYVQANRLLTATTPLGGDTLLLVGLTGVEAISQLFRFQLDLMAENDTEVAFDALLGKKVTAHVTAPEGKKRHFSGICSRIAQGGRDQTFTAYRDERLPRSCVITR